MSWAVLRRALLFCAATAVCWSPAEARQRPDPFAAGSVSAEFGVGAQTELWNLNEEHEELIEATASFWGAIKNGLCLGLTFNHFRVFQSTPGAFVQGFTPMIRWRFIHREPWSGFVETGPGISWSDLPTPPRGTKFNYLYQGAGGVVRRIGSNSHMLIGMRFVHLSNNHREGRDHNPDLEMLGGFVAVSFAF